MNTVRSVGYGWGALILAGGGAYYFAKRSINADRAERAEGDRKRRIQQRVEYEHQQYPPPTNTDGDVNPSREATQDPAPTRHAPDTQAQKTNEKSKYEASEPWRSRKGDRFS